MKEKLILVEGIPGAGKTTTARKLTDELIAQGVNVKLYTEGMLHPADMAWCAYLTQEEYNSFLGACKHIWENSKKEITLEELYQRIEIQTGQEDNHLILAYTKIDFPEDQYWNLVGTVADKEICDGRRSLKEFTNIYLQRWSKFAKEVSNVGDDTVYVFECAFLQNHIFELVGIYEKSDDEIIRYLKNLMDTVGELNPRIVYIKPKDVEKVIDQASQERLAPNATRKDWIDEIADWVSNMNYGKLHNLQGRAGVISFCKERLRLDLLALEELKVPVTMIERE